jgi:protein-tyrosine phosphatase
VEDGRLYRSGQISARLIEPTLRNHHIQVIVALAAAGMKPQDAVAEERAVADLGIDRELFALAGDGTGNVEIYAAAVAAIDKATRAGKPVLVHCVAGAQRTGGVIAAYRLLVEHRPAAEAYAEMRRFGHDPHDNPRLLEYLNAHMGEIAGRLVELGVISRMPETVPVLHAE